MSVYKSDEEWREFWRDERRREDEMLAFRDEFVGYISNKALAEKFNLKPTRVSLLVRRQAEGRHRAIMQEAIERLTADNFTAVAERLWMELGWLAMELERRATTSAAANTPPAPAPEPTRSSGA